ncbi:hypothetical protein FHG87_023627 [Trinorchestia longiramus]|nr:hypothetical protein FHG87_023627 [Trinorchestia longiramus]
MAAEERYQVQQELCARTSSSLIDFSVAFKTTYRLADELPRSFPANCSTHTTSVAPLLESSSASMVHPISANCSLLQDAGSVLNLSSPYSYSLSSPEHESHLHAVYMVGFPTFITVGVLANVVDLWVLAQSSMQGIAFR